MMHAIAQTMWLADFSVSCNLIGARWMVCLSFMCCWALFFSSVKQYTVCRMFLKFIMTLITVLLDTDIQLFFYYCSYSLVGTVSFDMTGQNTNSVSQLAFCYIVSPLMMRLMQNVFTCIKLSQQARIWFALESISLSNDITQFHYIFSDDIVQFNLNHFK